jgi:hypothetical protein
MNGTVSRASDLGTVGEFKAVGFGSRVRSQLVGSSTQVATGFPSRVAGKK